MIINPGLITLFGLSAAGLALVARRAWLQGRYGQRVWFSVSYVVLLTLVALPFVSLIAGSVYGLLRSARLEPFRIWVAASIWIALIAIYLAKARNLRGSIAISLPGAARAIPWGLSTLLGIAFITLTYHSLSLPVVKGSHYVLRYELIRFGALACGVVFLLGILSALLPWVLDRLERMRFVSFVGARHVRATKSGFLTVISVLSICGVAVSSCALCSVVSIMGGFGQDLKRKILGNNAHVTIDLPGQQGGFADWQELIDRVQKVRGVQAVTAVAAGEAMASSNANTAGVLMRGVDTSTIGNVIDLEKNIEYGKLDYLVDESKLQNLPPDEVIGTGIAGETYHRGTDLGSSFSTDATLDPSVRAVLRGPPSLPGLVIGRELSRTLHLMVGDEVTLISPLGDLGPMGVLPRSRKFRVAAIFYSGMYEYDATHIYVRTDVAQRFFNLGDHATALEVKAEDAEASDQLVPALKAAVDEVNPNLRVRDWREMNKNLFSALKLERIATFIILSIAIAVASFCIICTLLLMVTEKGKEIAIMKALGASNRAIRAIFMTEGMIIGGIGTVFGVATGVATCLGLKWFGVRLDPDVYYIDRLPVATNASDYVSVALAALVICSLATIYPAGAASQLRPVDGLRYE